MIYPSISELSDEGVNRYMLSIATAKCARRITDIHLENAPVITDAKDEKSTGFSSKKATANEKPVKEAIEKLYTREYKIVQNEEN